MVQEDCPHKKNNTAKTWQQPPLDRLHQDLKLGVAIAEAKVT